MHIVPSGCSAATCISGFYAYRMNRNFSRLAGKEFKIAFSFLSQHLKHFLLTFCVASREFSEAFEAPSDLLYFVVCFVKILSSVLCMVYRCNDVCVLYCSLIFFLRPKSLFFIRENKTESCRIL